MEISFINVGYGDAILVQKGTYTMLLDGGSACDAEFEGFPYRIRAVDYLRDTKVQAIDLLIISHIHEDHVCGLEQIVYQIPVREIAIPYEPSLFCQERSFIPHENAPRSAHLFARALSAVTRIMHYAEQNGIPVHIVTPRVPPVLSAGLELQVLAPSDTRRKSFEQHLKQAFTAKDPTEELVLLDRISNTYSLLLKLCGDGAEILLTADNCPSEWSEIDDVVFKNVNVLKLPHHGQIDSIEEKIAQIMPLKYVITTASSDRRYHSACASVYQTLQKLHPGVRFLFTDEREYPPFFCNPNGAQAIKIVVNSDNIISEFIKIEALEKMEE